MGSLWETEGKETTGVLGLDGCIICISTRWDVVIWTGLCCPRIETVGGRL